MAISGGRSWLLVAEVPRPTFPFPAPTRGPRPGGGQGVQGPPPSHRIGPSHCRCSQPGSSAGGPHSTRPMEHKRASPLPPPLASPPHLRRGPAWPGLGKEMGTHVWQLTAGPGPSDSGLGVCPTGQLGVLVTAHVSGVGREALRAGLPCSRQSAWFPLLQCPPATHT